MKQQFPTIAMTGGGSGGHITPLLSLAHELKAQAPNCQIVYIGHKGDQFDSLKTRSQDFDFVAFVNAGKFRRYHGESLWSHLIDFKTLYLNARDFFRVIRSIGTARKILARTRPDILFVKGGFVGVPVGIAARLARIPIITHDSDTIPGLANRIVGRWAAWHATGMPAELYKYKEARTRYVGIPLNPRIEPVTADLQNQYKKELNLPTGSQVLLVTGGGNGSVHLNQLAATIAPQLLAKNPNLQVVNITGQANIESAKKLFKEKVEPQLLQRVHVLAFVNDFYKYSGAADVIVSRAGATVIAEYAAQGKACIIIPIPASHHQLKNAEYLKKEKVAEVLNDNIDPIELCERIDSLLKDDSKRHYLEKNIKKIAKTGASAELAKLILEVASIQNG